ncbi:MAG: diacylglycerol kinase family protein [Clostridia bacterium]|nr:diacylglycerol kinase family protein [Clostridia bacterium]
MYHVLYNPLSGNGQGAVSVETIKKIIKEEELKLINVSEVKDYASFFAGLAEEDSVVVAGSDGTLNYFINDVDGVEIKNKVYFYALGTGNDFKNDVAPTEEGLIEINDYIKDLPIVEVKGMTRRFINGIGYGIDGYCCEVADKLAKENKPINYTGIAIKGLLFFYKPTNATVTVDGETKEFKKVWLAPSMNGRFYGGGMNIAPAQDRTAQPKTLSLVVFHGSGKLKTLMIFPSIFKGEHIKHEKQISIFTGKDITVKFDRPVALQIDGETVLDVTEYTVHANVPANSKVAPEAAPAEV